MLSVHLLINITFSKHPSPLINTIPHHIPVVAMCQRRILVTGFTQPPELITGRVRSGVVFKMPFWASIWTDLFGRFMNDQNVQTKTTVPGTSWICDASEDNDQR